MPLPAAVAVAAAVAAVAVAAAAAVAVAVTTVAVAGFLPAMRALEVVDPLELLLCQHGCCSIPLHCLVQFCSGRIPCLCRAKGYIFAGACIGNCTP